jgi:hypothetical protein
MRIFDDDRRICGCPIREQPSNRLGRARLGLESGQTVLDALVVDLGNGGRVAELGRTAQRCGQLLSVLSFRSEPALIQEGDAESSNRNPE